MLFTAALLVFGVRSNFITRNASDFKILVAKIVESRGDLKDNFKRWYK
jgi:hypothetical protein